MGGANAYFDLNSFLSEEEQVPVVFNSGCTALGKELDPRSKEDNVSQSRTARLRRLRTAQQLLFGDRDARDSARAYILPCVFQ